MKFAILAALCASSALAFTPQKSRVTPSVSTSAAVDDMPGAINFAAKEFKFDPLKLAETYEPFLPWFRESELRHGRTAMLAVVGFIATDFVRIPGEAYSFAAIPKTIDAHDALLKSGPMYQLLLWIGLWDLIVTAPAAVAAAKGERTPGDFGWTLMAPKDDAKMQKKKDSELLNGRLAMVAVGGIATQSVITGHGFPYI
ncbi:protein fucoxanthin chlorophyll a/c protein [Phaeodactylum tricornutum CCAP 1055/1]|jgi:hypothetical protein|uniref:Protein fucoxanthin chlorophyll a/c protein n=2 Tax=Phaeodactylum tricornutum TaxID=2850 RepID=B7G503_PHATC|nr:protein fucoxanthin chlorophyll a/c protein [Phaeodactylum tricornutum CCAP 1055/1]EEC46063.1 protein fucoxanthin chlorophyll a/c protein [Phaeodactylum tricornutum CCAP 1055/1]|mmetsp:Transcript_13504/g.32622  ORF Transcript_13504/g.32622 Transcript_13504/m.32622 type:complete len:199 (+) Transcript_13504:89-685(+)|eukprot:XP_002182162.1 protein fucoxanthin chlorophyll a/c protein [Phaeodactylum tricornutum CCAP 1055/1]